MRGTIQIDYVIENCLPLENGFINSYFCFQKYLLWKKGDFKAIKALDI